MSRLNISTVALDLPLVHPFKIARGEETVARTAIVRVSDGERTGVGESAPVARYGESVESVIEYFSSYEPPSDNPYRLQTILSDGIPPAARCGLDLALHDLIGKDVGKPLYELFGLDPSQTPVTSFTIGIATPETTLQKLSEAGDRPILKVKLGSGAPEDQIAIVAAIRERYTGTIRIDANEGWDGQTAVLILRELQRFGIEFCEQPIPAGRPGDLRAVRERCGIPIVADEDCCGAEDLPALYGCVDGVNIKLAKTGGLRGALATMATARAMGFKIMIGCMVESAVCATAAAHLSPLADWADIDGPFLTARDPFCGVRYDRGKLMLPDAPGIGVSETVAV